MSSLSITANADDFGECQSGIPVDGGALGKQ